MKGKDIRPESKVDAIELTIKEKSAVREVSTRSGRMSRVCDAKGEDEDGTEVSISLWNEEIDRVAEGNRIRISNGWAREWRGNLQVSAGRFGTLEVLE